MAEEIPKKSGIWTTERVDECLKEYEKTGVMPKRNPFFMGDVRARKPRLNYSYTKEELLELSKVSESVIYFGENYAKVITDDGLKIVKLRKYQIRVLKQFGYYRHNVWLASRQIGKSTFASVNIRYGSHAVNCNINELFSKYFSNNKFIFIIKNLFVKLYLWSLSN